MDTANDTDTPNDTVATVGLSEAEAARRLRTEGPNELPREARRSLPRIALDVVSEPMFQLLLAAAVIYLFLGSLGEAAMLLGSAAMTVGIAIAQANRTERTLEALRDLSSPRALVLRDGERRRIPGREVVRGDLILLIEGDRVPADATLIGADDLEADESLLTGESVPVRKRVDGGGTLAATPGGDDLPSVFAGSVIVRGQGLARVHATGSASEMGRIGRTLAAIDTAPTPLRLETRRLVGFFTVVGTGVSAAAALLYLLLRGGWIDALLAGITLAMSLLPEEFPLVLTVFLVAGAWRIARERVLTRRAATIETLGAATVLCTDKTGTLTLNRMSIAELRRGDTIWRAESGEALPEPVHPLVEFGILASRGDPVDPMERAFHALGSDALARTEHLHPDWKVARSYGLTPGLLAMSQAWRDGDGGDRAIAAKGAPEAIVDLCHLNEAEARAVLAAADEMARRGMRVLAVAEGRGAGGAWPESQHDFDFTLLGLVGLADPLRPGIGEAIRACRAAGVRVVMITGDYPATAGAIAAESGLDVDGGLVTGEELAALDDRTLRDRVRQATVFARIMPAQKLRIVEALQANGEIVAMTGDGVNDAPALKAADIGIAMGGRGTDVAREASALVLLDDSFGSIVAAIRLGRRIYDNLRKAMTFILAVHVPIGGLALLPLLVGWPMIFAPVHIAFLELVIDPVCSIVFEAEAPEADLMRRPPRPRGARLFSWRLIGWGLFQGVAVLGLVTLLYALALDRGTAEPAARAIAFSALVLGNFGMVLLDRSSSASLARAFVRPNPALWSVLAVTLALLTAAIYLPPVAALFRFAPLSPAAAALVLGATGATLLGLEAVKPVLLGRRIKG